MSLAADYARHHGELIRRAVLQLLAELPGERAVDPAIHTAIEAMDLACTRDQLRGHLGWLGEQGLINAETNRPGVIVAELTERGGEVARGAAVVSGVSRKALGS